LSYFGNFSVAFGEAEVNLVMNAPCLLSGIRLSQAQVRIRLFAF